MMMFRISLIAVLLLPLAAAESTTSRPYSLLRPPFLSHVDLEHLEQSKTLAVERHKRAVARALEHYPTDSIDGGEKASIDPALASLSLKTMSIHGPGSLPDFNEDLERRIYVTDPTPLLTKEECNHVIQMAEEHFHKTNNGTWPLQTSGQYQVAGFYIHSVPSVHAWFTQACRERLFPLVSQTFPQFCVSPQDLCVDNAYLFKYTRETGQRTEVHTDSGVLSFTMALNGKDEYAGGGTWFEGLDNENSSSDGVLEMTEAGQVTLRPGGLKHCGHAVERGTRYIIGGFCMHKHRPELVRQLLTPDVETSADQQLRAAEAAVVLNPACDAAYNILANEYDQRGDKEKARQVLEYCLENVHPNSGECAYALGSLHMDQKLYDKAKKCFDICLQGDSCDVEALSSMALVCSALGDRQSEETYYKRLIEIPRAKPSALSIAYCNLGVLYEGKDEEVSFYQKALEVLPTAFAPRYSLACCYASRQQWEKACEAFRQAATDADSSENAEKAVRALYQAASNWIRLEHSGASALSREAVVERFQQIMGVENYNKLAAMR